jgi:hypothetical protein
LFTAATTVQTVQKTLNPGKPLTSVAYSHVRARYPQAGPQSLGASGKAVSRYPQGFARGFEIFCLTLNRPLCSPWLFS